MAVMYALTELRSLEVGLPTGGLAFAVVEGPATAQFLNVVEADFLGLFPSGTAFGPTRSVQWLRRRNGAFHLVVIDDVQPAPPDVPHLVLESLPEEQPTQLLLMGSRHKGRLFREGRIPADIKYPDDSEEEQLAVEIRHYVDESGTRRVWRCVGLRGA